MSLWQQISNVFVAEFSDLKDVTEVIQIGIRLSVAAILGGLLGFEREQRGKAAGIKTHMLVCIGAALFVLIPFQAGVPEADMSRIVQGVIAGIGFLGAGAILKGQHEKDLKGMTTAAGIWLTAAIGVAVGMGREASAILCTFLALLILVIIPRIVTLLERKMKR